MANAFPVLWTIDIGTHPTVAALVAETEASGADFASWSKRLLPLVTVSSVLQTLRLVAPSVADLGFTEATPRDEVYVRAIKSFGLGLCPSEAALQFCRQCIDDWPKSELCMAMEVLNYSDDPYIFYVGSASGVRCVYAGSGYPESPLRLHERLVFVLPEA